ncbi:MAG: aminotransferase class I/II-fold pyridoxal phosphate-dependent enzyme [Oscillospiraceae bacterium]|nr:aminotransferase class I/II-fold pyridoxal phosphate-dependent enzyme [Oscillospiraceae bacterium]
MYYQNENPHGGDIYGEPVLLDYSANTNPLGTPPAVISAAEKALREADRYPDPYCRALVKAIAAAEGVPESFILCGNGASELILAFCAALRPRLAASLAPTFSEYAAAVALNGGETVFYPLREEADFLPEGDFLPWLREQGADALFLCSPNNPTGRLLEPALLGETLKLCREAGVRILLDECFLDFTAGESCREQLRACPNLTILKAFTKSYGMAGLRLGYCLCADGDLLRSMAERTAPWNVSGPAQAAGTAALGERAFLEEALALVGRERPRLKAGLEDLGLWVCPSEANFLLFRGPEDLGDRLRQRGVAIRNCANFTGLGPGWYRIAVRTGEENSRLLAAMGECV